MVAEDASAFEAKCQRVDAESLPEVVAFGDAAVDVVHVYGAHPSPALLRGISAPFVTSSSPRRSIVPWRRTRQPAAIVAPGAIPEAVEKRYRSPVVESATPRDHFRIATYCGRRPGVENMIGQTLVRIHRFRDDIDWLSFDTPPEPGDLHEIDLWVDPATREEDLDGFVAEALSTGRLVVASRTGLNQNRLGGGRFGFLVRPNDPNELAHAVLNALFKEEASGPIRLSLPAASRRFLPDSRVAALLAIYEGVVA